MHIVLSILILIFSILQVDFWIGKGNVLDYFRLQELVEQQKKENTHLIARNDLLAREVKILREGTEATEERARSELGLIKNDEIFYHVIESE